jgi:fructose PTS system EIIA component
MCATGLEDQRVAISDVITPKMVDLTVSSFGGKDEVFRHLISLLFSAGAISSEEEFLNAIYGRESLGPTYMGEFIAIPHGKSTCVTRTAIAFCRCAESFFYTTDDGGGDVKLVFMLAIPDRMSANEYIRLLSRLARLLVYSEFVTALYEAQQYEDVIQAIEQYEVLLD